jgi:tRNA modification GTPase
LAGEYFFPNKKRKRFGRSKNSPKKLFPDVNQAVTTRNNTDTTIAAIATPPGSGGIGIIRISGEQALPILKLLFKPNLCQDNLPDFKFNNRRLCYGWIIDPKSGVLVDEVLAVFMQAPHTYTTEDIVEIQCHGSYLVLQQILELVFAAGAVPSFAGEFTKRAFLNGRIDLTRAEAVIDLIEARTREGLQLATGQLKGRLHRQIESIREVLIAIRAIIEVAIDFPGEDLEIINHEDLLLQLHQGVITPLQNLIAAADQGKIFREGISVVILGKPNVGKSSLLNSLLREERALVTEIPGTTRDTIEESINIRGMAVRIIDTAGIRDTTGIVEGMGIQRAQEKLAVAVLALLLFDSSQPLDSEDRELYKRIRGENRNCPILIVANKTDLPEENGFSKNIKLLADEPLVRISAKTHAGIDLLAETIFKMMTGDAETFDPKGAIIPNVRHKDAMCKALAACEQLADGLQNNLSPDLLAIELMTALDHIGEIIGETTTEDVLDVIFNRFCIGK